MRRDRRPGLSFLPPDGIERRESDGDHSGGIPTRDRDPRGEKHGGREAPSGGLLGTLVHGSTMLPKPSEDKVIRTDLLRKRGSDRLEAAERAEDLVPLSDVLLGHRP